METGEYIYNRGITRHGGLGRNITKALQAKAGKADRQPAKPG